MSRFVPIITALFLFVNSFLSFFDKNSEDGDAVSPVSYILRAALSHISSVLLCVTVLRRRRLLL